MSPHGQHPNTSEYTLATVHLDSPPRSASSSIHSALLSPDDDVHNASYGAAPAPHPPQHTQSPRMILLAAGLRMAIIFIASCALLGGTLWLALPTLDEEDRPDLRIPKSFAQLQALNSLLKKYRDIYPYRIVVCYVTTYLFLQAFSLPGSMYLSILGGAVWGVPIALPLACACVATGATLCYLISAAFGPALHTFPSWRARLDTWSVRVSRQRSNLISFLIVLRIAPIPPHWVVNVLCPHIGIGIVPFWISTFLGIFGVTVIHTTIGGGLDQMTSADDFHLISWRNFFLLGAVVIGVLVPVGLRYYFRTEVNDAAVTEHEAEVEAVLFRDNDAESQHSMEDPILAEGPRANLAKGKSKDADKLILLDDDEEDDFLEDDDEDIILEAGPAIVVKAKDERSAGGSSQPSSV